MSLKDKLQNKKTQDAVFNPKVLLHRLVVPADVQQMVRIKEKAPEIWLLGVDQQDPETLNIKEEEEELWPSQEGEQFCVKKETDDTGFAFTAVPLKSVEDEEKPLFLQLHQHQVKGEDLTTSSSADQMKVATGGEDCGGAETTRNADLNTYEDVCSSSETEVSEDDEGDDVNDSDSQLKDLSDSGSESDIGDKDWKEGRAPESGVNTVNKSCSSTEHEKQFHKTNVQQMVLIKEEAPDVQMLGVDQQDPGTLNIKEEEEELWTSQEGEQFCLHQHQVKEEDLPTSSSADQMKVATGGEDCGGA
ncbi:uncharacterized protein LOC119421152 [Nematolebias whitei]|uniref:uncharacterized protein LOC119421152 n=1 Tax=Nematolebias whitei TaxID=451745 RepID=UPI0018975E15|nr:uncharacterized protein LOC119421152 [Nematolebias whitei]